MTDRTFDAVDVAIVGGGVVGCATAWNLAKAGVRVAVFERATVASEQSSRAWGFIRQQGRHEAEIPLAIEAKREWASLTQHYGQAATGYTRGGILVPAETPDDEERVTRGHELARQFGMSTRIVDRAGIAELVPQLAGNWRSGLFTEDDAHGDPHTSTRTIAQAAKEAGARIFENEPVLDIETSGGRISGIATLSGRCAAGAVLIAGGIGSRALALKLGINLPIQVVTSSVGATTPASPFTQIAVWAPRVAYRPKADGSFTLGNGYRGLGADYNITPASFSNLRYFLPAYRQNWRLLRLTIGGDFVSQARAMISAAAAAKPLPEPRPNASKVQRNFAAFKQLFPHLDGLGLERMWAGRIDLTPDVIPIIDQPDRNRSLFVAAGFSGHGFALGPSVGKQLAEWIAGGRPSLDLGKFRLSRFEEGEAKREKQAL